MSLEEGLTKLLKSKLVIASWRSKVEAIEGDRYTLFALTVRFCKPPRIASLSIAERFILGLFLYPLGISFKAVFKFGI